MVDIEAKGSGPLSVGNYIQFGRSHESDFHRITRFGSKICHRSVTGVTCDTRVAVCDKYSIEHFPETSSLMSSGTGTNYDFYMV